MVATLTHMTKNYTMLGSFSKNYTILSVYLEFGWCSRSIVGEWPGE